MLIVEISEHLVNLAELALTHRVRRKTNVEIIREFLLAARMPKVQ
jgi:hypothetical protein